MAGKHTTNSYFVSHLLEDDRPSLNMQFEIQVLNSKGQAIACGYIDRDSNNLEINGQTVPLSVIEAAKRQTVGNGDYVNELGSSIPPF